MNIYGEPVSLEDIHVIKGQIKSKNVNPYGILHRCSWGFPVLICQNVKIKNRLHLGNLSNPIWLTCPYLNYEIHEIENRGMIASVNEFILNDRGAMEKMQDAHAHFYYYRKHLYEKQWNSNYDEDLIEHLDLGIGGIADTRFLKCLHLHFSHYLIFDNNVAGYMVLQLLQKKTNCKDGRCVCLKE